MLAPIAAVLLFFAAIVVSFWYLRLEEIEREREAVTRDLEYAQQRLRLRLLERQEQLMRLARDVATKETDPEQFMGRAESLVAQYPELEALTWFDARGKVIASRVTPSLASGARWIAGEFMPAGPTADTARLARELMQPVYSQPKLSGKQVPPLQLHIPLADQGSYAGEMLGEYSIDSLLRYGVPSEVSSKYAMALLDASDTVLAGQSIPARSNMHGVLPWSNRINQEELPVSPVGNGLVLRAQAWRTSLGVIGSGLFWLVGALSLLTAWMLMANWRHTRRRAQAQQALLEETAFRRAMENSMLTGMRTLDLQGRITYVNPAFCRMTGWSEEELVGQTPPYPYWPEEDVEQLRQRLRDELAGDIPPAGIQFRVKRKDGSRFDARLYVSPLVDASGRQTGWMTSMTDITEPNRIREQLQASHARFTAVLEALDASVSVAPLGSEEMLFANKLYRLWFGSRTDGHLRLLQQAGRPIHPTHAEQPQDEDALAGLPTDSLVSAEAENAEVYVKELGMWLEVRSRYLSWVDGRLAQMVIATDITARRRAEELAAAQAERAQAASRLITMGEMASSVAHELNQPLTAISNYCNGMLSRIRAGQHCSEDLVGALEKTARQAQRAGQIIQRIKSFVRRSEPNRQPSDVQAIVAEAIELAEIEFRRRNVRLTPYLAERLPTLDVDPILIEQVLVNLLKNAAESIDAAGRASAQRLVELRVVPQRVEGIEAVTFSVTDTGSGLAPEVLERVFEAFFSTKAEGMGIGLNLCRSIVESHQGRLTARNLYNGDQVVGCCFSFWLPLTGSAHTGAFEDSGVTA
ncbi:MAG: oxygen sensor histidine kinase FixL [Tibeticola sp.]